MGSFKSIQLFIAVQVAAIIFLFVGSVFAAPIDYGPSFIAGYGNDDLREVFTPPETGEVFQLVDYFAGAPIIVFGFYEVANPSNAGILFGTEDQGGSHQASIDFITGTVEDVDAGVIESTFTPFAGDMGYFIQIDGGTPLFPRRHSMAVPICLRYIRHCQIRLIICSLFS